MEYLVGAIVSGLLVTFAHFLYNKTVINNKPFKLKISQSSIYSMLPTPLVQESAKTKNTQSFKHFYQNNIKVLFAGPYAYWIKDNAVYRASIKNGKVIEKTTEKLDMMGMDKVQLDEMMFIVEKLTEGTNNDYWSSGN